MASPARAVALAVLVDAERGGPALGERLARRDVESLPPRDQAFLRELVLGTLRHRGAVDYALGPCSDRPLDRIEPTTLAALRLGAYQLLHLRVPQRAAVFESVALCRAHTPRAAGFVNAVLRRLCRTGAPSFPDPSKNPLDWLTTEGSLPAWLAQRWCDRLGPERSVARARRCLAPPRSTFRLNPRYPDTATRLDQAGVKICATDLPGCFDLVAGRIGDFAAEGRVYIQDFGSQLVGHLAARGRRVLDVCAAPGGKALLIADAINGMGTVVAAELSPRRLHSLAALLRVWRAPNVRMVRCDGVQPPFAPVFDTVLLDAPCTGLGTIARHPDIRWRVNESDLRTQSARQSTLLRSLAKHLRGGALLVYATCSSEPEENEDVVRAFLSEHPEFDHAPLPVWASPYADGPFVRTSPETTGCDALFAALLRCR